MTQYGLTYPMVLDDGSLVAEFAITAYPTTIFFDAERQGGGPPRRRVHARPVQRLAGQGAVTRAVTR